MENTRKGKTPRSRTTLALILVAVLIISSLPTHASRGAAYAVQYDPAIAGMISQVSQNTLYTYVANLSGVQAVTIGGTGTTLQTRNTASGTPVQKATQYLYEYMQGLPGMDSVSYQNWQAGSSSSRNVVGTLTGSTKPGEIVLLTAHVDDMPDGSSAPGADDNASGSAALMLAASLLSRHTFERTIRFVIFTGEEQDLYGSAAYAQAARSAGENIIAVENMDMLAWESDGNPTMRVHTRPSGSGAKDLEIANLFVNVVSAYAINLKPIITSYGMAESDHGSFWAQGYAAVCIIEDDGDQQSDGDFNPYYHSTADTLARLNLPYFTNIVAATVGATAHLAYLNEGAPAISATFTPTTTWTRTLTPGFTATRTRTPAFTNTATRTVLPSITFTPVPATKTATRVFSPTRTSTPGKTFTPVRTGSPTKVFTSSPTKVPSQTATRTRTSSPTKVFTPTKTMTPSAAILVNPSLSPAFGSVCASGWYKLAQGGYNQSDLYLTLNVRYAADSYNSAKWTPSLPKSGRYKVEAYIGQHASVNWACPSVTVSQNTSKASYAITYSGGKVSVVVDQVPFKNAWAGLGTYTFAAGKTGSVSLTDITGESDLALLIAFNTLRFTWVGP